MSFVQEVLLAQPFQMATLGRTCEQTLPSQAPHLFFAAATLGTGDPILTLREVFRMSVTHGYKCDSFPLVTITASGFYYRCLYNNFHII